MTDCKLEERQTLIQAFENLDDKCSQLQELTQLTLRLKGKLDRTEGQPKAVEEKFDKQVEEHRNIVELFNDLANRIQIQIEDIHSNIGYSMSMID